MVDERMARVVYKWSPLQDEYRARANALKHYIQRVLAFGGQDVDCPFSVRSDLGGYHLTWSTSTQCCYCFIAAGMTPGRVQPLWVPNHKRPAYHPCNRLKRLLSAIDVKWRYRKAGEILHRTLAPLHAYYDVAVVILINEIMLDAAVQRIKWLELVIADLDQVLAEAEPVEAM